MGEARRRGDYATRKFRAVLRGKDPHRTVDPPHMVKVFRPEDNPIHPDAKVKHSIIKDRRGRLYQWDGMKLKVIA